MDEYELILDFFGKLSCIVNEIRSRGGRISDAEVASKLLIHVSSMSTLQLLPSRNFKIFI